MKPSRLPEAFKAPGSHATPTDDCTRHGHTAALSPFCRCTDDQELTDELLKWLLEGKSFQTMPTYACYQRSHSQALPEHMTRRGQNIRGVQPRSPESPQATPFCSRE